MLDSDDTRVMVAGLGALGGRLEADWHGGGVVVEGTGGAIPATEAVIDCAASGTTMRFLSAVCALGSGVYRLDGTPRMRRRPIGDLLEALGQLGVEATAESPGGCPPVRIEAHGLAGGVARVRGSTSSQFASGLALAAPCSRSGLRIEFEGELVSTPYLRMTRRVMERFGARCDDAGDRAWQVPPTGYTACDYAIEPDASAASYCFAAAAITGGSVRVEGLSRESLQGDVGFCDVLAAMGCQVAWEPASGPRGPAVTVSGRAARGIDVDMNAISDTVPTLAVVAMFATGPTVIRNVAHIRDKETDRIGDLVRELRRLGVDAEEHATGLTVATGTPRGADVETYDDHRMAMSLALAGLRVPGVRIRDPGCVGKTFPGYWRELARLVAGAAGGGG